MKSTSSTVSNSFLHVVSLSLLLLVVAPLHAAELRVSVAASMTNVFKDVIADYSKSHPEVTIRANFGPSGGLAKQIDKGAPADLYVSANPKWANYLLEHGRLDPSKTALFAYNRLVFMGRTTGAVGSMAELATLQRIGIGSPRSVPAGQYAQQALSGVGLYDTLLAEGRLVMAKDVRQALIYADRGEVDGSFVYKTDALLAKNAKILFEVPTSLYDRVSYPLALTLEGAAKAQALDLYKYLLSARIHPLLERYGFTLPE